MAIQFQVYGKKEGDSEPFLLSGQYFPSEEAAALYGGAVLRAAEPGFKVFVESTGIIETPPTIYDMLSAPAMHKGELKKLATKINRAIKPRTRKKVETEIEVDVKPAPKRRTRKAGTSVEPPPKRGRGRPRKTT